MKTIILCAVIVLASFAAHAQNSFTSRLPASLATADARVSVLKDQTLLIRYTQNEISYMVFYDNNGNWLNTVASYYGSSLPASVRSEVMASWHGWNISHVNEVQAPATSPVYQIQLQRENRLVILKVSDEGMETEKEFSSL